MTTNPFWINIYGAGYHGIPHPSRAAADYAARGYYDRHYPIHNRVIYRIKVTLKENEDARQRTRHVPSQTSGYSYAGYKDTEGRGKCLR